MTIHEDPRKIVSLVLNDGKQISGEPYRRITPYMENGQMAGVVWFQVERRGELEQRVNAAHVRQVVY